MAYDFLCLALLRLIGRLPKLCQKLQNTINQVNTSISNMQEPKKLCAKRTVLFGSVQIIDSKKGGFTLATENFNKKNETNFVCKANNRGLIC